MAQPLIQEQQATGKKLVQPRNWCSPTLRGPFFDRQFKSLPSWAGSFFNYFSVIRRQVTRGKRGTEKLGCTRVVGTRVVDSYIQATA